VKPGLTGLWQVSGRNDVSYADRVAMDREYRHRASFAFDLGIVLRTVPAVLGAHGSY
jgi:exopolysaccharide production protein ExoY